MPNRDDLPPELRAITRRNALELSDLRWRYDVGRLMSALDEALLGPGATTAPGAAAAAPHVSSAARRRAGIAAALAVAVAGGVAALLLISGDPHEPRAPSTATGDSVSLSVAKPGDTPPPVHVDIGKSDEQTTLTFDGTRGERIAPDVRNVTAPFKISIVDPADQTVLGAERKSPDLLLTDKCPTPTNCRPVKLTRSGTHDVIISGTGDDTGSLDLRLYAVAPDVRKETSLRAGPLSVELGVGQAATVRFPSPDRYEQIILRFLNIELNGFVNVRDRAGGLALKDTAFFASDGEREFRVNVSRPGTYTIHIRTNGISSGAVRMDLGSPLGK
jgi:hypothetical protein